MNMDNFDYNDFSWDMVQPESKTLGRYMIDRIPVEFTFIDGEILIGEIKWYDEMSIGILNNLGEEIYIDKRSLKWLKVKSEK
ncbi:MAG TPA: hypothetical protein PL110_00040 [Candidatus Eremiobacteraeota bacterium]|nr:MAG: hypothetical protein BWY64_00258 [bacterium ADurb.Bin363]HPZ06474.1 hypothetical protein [Candidatus Eremiobacteraeota bacterium]